jgi:hypothetical protein
MCSVVVVSGFKATAEGGCATRVFSSPGIIDSFREAAAEQATPMSQTRAHWNKAVSLGCASVFSTILMACLYEKLIGSCRPLLFQAVLSCPIPDLRKNNYSKYRRAVCLKELAEEWSKRGKTAKHLIFVVDGSYFIEECSFFD